MPALIDAGLDGDGRIIKRQRRDSDRALSKRSKHGASRLFAPYRTIGLVSPTTVPFTSVPLGKTTFQLTTSVGHALQTYDVRRGLNLVFITRPQTPRVITASVAWRDLVFAAWGDGAESSVQGLWAFKRGKRIAELEVPADLGSEIKGLYIFGPWIVGCCDTQLLVWKNATFELYTSLHGTSGSAFTGCITSMPTMLNKVFAGKADGSVEIWNVSSGKLVYTILSPAADYGAVTTIEPTPAVSLLGIAYAAGPVIVHNVRADETVIQLNIGELPSGPAVTSIAFRTDGLGAGNEGRKSGVMATASTQTGDITFWDLNDGGRKAGVLRAGHAFPSDAAAGGVSKIGFLPGQSVLVSSGLDNILKTWIFDETPFSTIPRPLHSRGGHGGAVSSLMFLPSASDGSDMSGKWLMAASQDRSLWGWSLRRDGQSTELSQGAVRKKAKKAGILASEGKETLEGLKAPPITCLACSLNRDGGMGAMPGKQSIWQAPGQKGRGTGDTEGSSMTGWESVVTAHEGDSKARTWFWGRKRAGRWAFETGDKSEVKSVAVSPCGTFALIGSASGGIDMFNLQSGLHRQRYPPRLTPSQARQLKITLLQAEEAEELVPGQGQQKVYRGLGKHTAAVTGLAVDNLNRTIISCGADGRIKFWDFQTGTLRHEIKWSGAVSITGLSLHRSSELAALACSDGCIRVVDISTQRLVRELKISKSTSNPLADCRYLDFAFSSDGRWLSAATEAMVAVWDLPTGHLVDAFRLPAKVNALSFSPTGEYLATASADNVGIDIWSNRTLFTHVPTRHIDEAELLDIMEAAVNVPTTAGVDQHLLAAEDGTDDDDDADLDLDLDDLDEQDADHLASDLISLSLVPRSRWQNLLHLDSIKQRNKPIAPPKKPEKAPFFLPSLQDRQRKTIDDASASRNPQDVALIETERSRISKMDRSGNQSTFTILLQRSAETGESDAVLEHLKTLSPALADVEIRSLSSGGEEGTTTDEHVAFVEALTSLLHSKRDFELGQAWMAVFLRLHGDVIVENETLREAVKKWDDAARSEKERVQVLAGYCSGMVGFLRAGRV